LTGSVQESLRRLVADLARLRVRYALVGGFAVSTRAAPRFTRDVDVCVSVEHDADAERLVHDLTGIGYQVAAVVEHEQSQRLAAARLISPVPGSVLVDLLFASSGVEPEIVEAAELLEILPQLRLPVARSAHLVVLKLLARDDGARPQDAMDLRALRPVLTDDDAAEALELARLVTTRGYDRGRDLMALTREYTDDRAAR